MESSGPLGNTAEPPRPKLVEIIGTTIAVLTLILPLAAIAYYSSTNNLETLPGRNYTLPQEVNKQ